MMMMMMMMTTGASWLVVPKPPRCIRRTGIGLTRHSQVSPQQILTTVMTHLVDKRTRFNLFFTTLSTSKEMFKKALRDTFKQAALSGLLSPSAYYSNRLRD